MQDGETGAAPGSSTCQVPGCGVNLNRLRPYFRRQRICEEHARAESVPDGRGGLARFCQQCTRLEPLSFFDGQRRSCRSSLAKRQERMSAARRRNHSGSDERLSSSNSDGLEDAGEEACWGHGLQAAACRWLRLHPPARQL
ncbi:Squamosa promoter-binding 1 [Chlorella sorokiniana]|uniref:Squamosa promoter-binding 1 n=1 Tax=Chlorella sorokiniana TaxID=3076 RepID=A0A2P6U3K0_CHLSO|nr:Squamosa promoter-binding 1 [Chlorella sorokiniana]|eukprot:PRW60887.1 Squamosa promoter-binding 1 [Chlorella sorokiniana]